MTFNFNRRLKKRLMVAKDFGFKKPSNFLTTIPEDTIVVGTNSIPPLSIQVLAAPLQSVAGEAIQGLLIIPTFPPSPLTVRVTNIDSNIPRRNVAVTATLWDGTINELSSETFSSNSTVTVVSDANGYCVFNNLKIEKAGSYRIGYKSFNFDGSLVEFKPFTDDDRSSQFIIIPAPVTRIGIDRQPPTSITSGQIITPAPQVTLYDQYNNPATFYNVYVRLNKNNFSPSSTSSIFVSENPVSFNNLAINTVDTSYRMIFEVQTAFYPSITSTPFDINVSSFEIYNVEELIDHTFTVYFSGVHPNASGVNLNYTTVFPPQGNFLSASGSKISPRTLNYVTQEQYLYIQAFNEGAGEAGTGFTKIVTYDRFNVKLYQFIVVPPPPPTISPIVPR